MVAVAMDQVLARAVNPLDNHLGLDLDKLPDLDLDNHLALALDKLLALALDKLLALDLDLDKLLDLDLDKLLVLDLDKLLDREQPQASLLAQAKHLVQVLVKFLDKPPVQFRAPALDPDRHLV